MAMAALIVLPVYFTLGATGIQVAFQLASGDLGIGYAGMHHAELIRQLEDAEVPEDRLKILSVLIMRHSLEGEDVSPFWPTFQQEIRALPETSIERIRYQRSLAHLCRQFEPSGCGAGYLRDALSLALAAGPEQEIFVHQIWNDLIVIQPSAEAALSEWNSAYTNATGRKDMEWQVDLLMLQGRLLVQAADIPRAEQSYRRAWEIAEGLDDVWVLQSAGTEQAGFYLAQGNKTAAYQVMQAQCARETARDREEVGLALSACYRLAKQRGIEEAGLALALLEPLSFAAPESQLELVMARLMLSGESPPLSEAAAEQLRSAQKKLQNEWQWYALAENLLLGSESVSSNDPSSESFRITGFTPVSGDWDMAFQEYARQLPGTKPLNEALATLEFEYAELD